MPATCHHADASFPRRFPLFRWISRTRRSPRLDLAGLPDELLRDLGFQDGHIAPPRNIFRD
jgi:hypothetical protein